MNNEQVRERADDVAASLGPKSGAADTGHVLHPQARADEHRGTVPTGESVFDEPARCMGGDRWEDTEPIRERRAESRDEGVPINCDNDIRVKLYIAGPMRGKYKWNFPAFDYARDKIKNAGYHVVSPADLDREAGLNPDHLPADVFNRIDAGGWKAVPDWFDLDAAMERDIEEMLKCGAVMLLDGWEDSAGARHEADVAFNNGIPLWGWRAFCESKPKPPVRREILEEAAELTCGDRNNQYGPPTQDFDRVAKMLSALGYQKARGHEIEPHDVAIIMACLKLSRLMWSPEKRDSWVDLAGYAACGYETVGRGDDE